jgi:hypothetical protein
VNPKCIFGEIQVAYFKYESSGRGGKHGHGQILQRALQADNLKRLFSENRTNMQSMLYDFMESFASSVFPWPSSSLEGLKMFG